MTTEKIIEKLQSIDFILSVYNRRKQDLEGSLRFEVNLTPLFNRVEALRQINQINRLHIYLLHKQFDYCELLKTETINILNK